MSGIEPPLCFLAQLASGQTCCGTDRDGEAWLKVLLSRQDAARVLARLDELQEGFYITLVPEAQVQGSATKGRRGRQHSTDG